VALETLVEVKATKAEPATDIVLRDIKLRDAADIVPPARAERAIA
jgi:hypothetical protein